jgi:dynein heavy chain
VKQNYARRCCAPIDAITFDYSCLPASSGSPEQQQPCAAEGGAVVSGMFVEGARWDAEAGRLAESHPKVGLKRHLLLSVQACVRT